MQTALKHQRYFCSKVTQFIKVMIIYITYVWRFVGAVMEEQGLIKNGDYPFLWKFSEIYFRRKGGEVLFIGAKDHLIIY